MNFSFKDLQSVQRLEENTSQATLALKTNSQVLLEMRQSYLAMIESADCPQDTKQECEKETARFQRRVTRVVKDLEMNISRAEALLSQIRDRKTLVSKEVCTKFILDTMAN